MKAAKRPGIGGRPPALGHASIESNGQLVPVTVQGGQDPGGGIDPQELDETIKAYLDVIVESGVNERLSTPLLTECLRVINSQIAAASKDPARFGDLFPADLVRTAKNFTSIVEQIQRAAAWSMRRFDQMVRLRLMLHQEGRAEKPRDFTDLSDAELRRIVSQAGE